MATPREQLAATLKDARLSAGFSSHGALARKMNVSRPVVTRAENAIHPVPSDAVLAAWCGATGLVTVQVVELAARCRGGTPEWFMPYAAAESQATSLRSWSPLLVPGLLQCEGYARSVLTAEPYTAERLGELVKARMERQEVLKHAYLTAIIDAQVLQRRIGATAVMAEQCSYLASMATQPNIAWHIVPEYANVGLWGAFDVASRDGNYTVRMTALRDVTSTASEMVNLAMQAYERILGAALPRAESLEFTQKAEELWKQQI
jgi:transcriptional regulator with XRE-family HTH domain